MLQSKFYRQLYSRFYSDEEGQATTEYILVLAMIMGFLVMTIKKLITPAFAKFSSNITGLMDQRIMKADLHCFRVGH